MSYPELWIIAGPNGAGKTTCVSTKSISDILPDVDFLNPDERTLTKLRSLGYQGFSDAPVDVQTRLFFVSADEVLAELNHALAGDRKVGVETVLSSDKYRSPVESVQRAGGIFCLVYVALSSPQIAKERVAARVKRGGHGIPDDKIEQRWKRSLDNLPWFIQRASNFWVIDNSNSDPQCTPLLVASGKLGSVEFVDENVFAELKNALLAV